jgi:hypothetical protein
MRLIVALVVWVGCVAGAFALSSAVAQQTGSQTTSGQTASQSSPSQSAGQSSPGQVTTPSFDPSAVKPTGTLSLFREQRLAAALAIVRRHFGAKANIEQLVVRPGELQLLVISGGNRQDVIVDANGAYLESSAGPLVGSADVFYLSQVQVRAPSALARRIAASGHVPTSRLDYMILQTDPIVHRFYWLVYPKRSDVHFQADGANSPIQLYGHNGATTLRG